MKLRIRQISESEFTVQGHGVHTAFKELYNALAKRDDTTAIINKKAKVDITHIHTVGLYSLFFLLFGSGKKVVSAHVVPKSFIGSLAGAKYWLPLANIYLRWFYNRADLVLAVSDETKRELQSMGVTKPIEIFYNIVDSEFPTNYNVVGELTPNDLYRFSCFFVTSPTFSAFPGYSNTSMTSNSSNSSCIV